MEKVFSSIPKKESYTLDASEKDKGMALAISFQLETK